MVKEDKVFDIYVTLALLRPNVEIVIPEYLLNIINSPLCKVQFNENLTGIGVPNLHLRDIKDVKIKVPSISEQEIISDKVEMLLANEGMVTKNCLKQIEVIDTMKKSILAKAFRGELGTNNPTEDSALNLLKEVLQDKSGFAELHISLNIVNESRYVRVFFEIQPAVITTFALSDLMALSEGLS